MQGNLLNRPKRQGLDGSDLSDAALDYQHQIEKDLTNKVEATLEPLLGDGKFRVGISADVDFTTTEQSEEDFDPNKSVMVSSQKSEDVSSNSQNAGVPGTASNLPRPTSRPATVGSSVSRRTENVNFQTSRTVKHVKIPQGGVKRISASLLIDQDVRWEGKGNQMHRVLMPPTPEKIKAIHDIVAGVLGIVPDRGDQLVIESLPFEQTLSSEPPVGLDAGKTPSSPKSQLDALLADKRVLYGVSGGVLLLVLLLAFLLLGRKKAVSVHTQTALPAASGEAGAEKKIDGAEAIEAVREEGYKLPLPPPTTKVEVLRQHLRETVRTDPEFTASILRGWLEEDRHRS
jgi:flagellar M-ring protein FliF